MSMSKINKTILVVEDEVAMLRALSAKLELEGFNVFKAEDGKKGLEIALKERPDLIMLDILMPKMNGIEVLKKIRDNQSWGAKALIIMLSNLSDADSVSQVAEYGVYDFLVKTDWRLEDVLKFVKNKLGIK